jgi:hypothetical protein
MIRPCSVACSVALCTLFAAGHLRAVTVFTTDFESGVPSAISGAGSLTTTGGLSSIGFGANHFRNDTAGFPGLSTLLTLSGLAPHTTLTIQFDLATWDSWDGNTFTCCIPDVFNVELDSVSILSEFYRNQGLTTPTGFGTLLISTPAVDLGQNPIHPDSAWRVSITVPHSATTAALAFFASGGGWQGTDDESWGLDNILISTDALSDDVPEPSSLLLVCGALVAGYLRKRATAR